MARAVVRESVTVAGPGGPRVYSRGARPGALWVPTISSRPRDQAIFIDNAADASAPSCPVLLENDRLR